MKTSKLSRLLALVLALVLALGCLMPISAVQSQDRDEVLQSETFSGEPTTLNRLDETGEPVEIMVMLDGQTEYVRTGDLELANKKAPEQLATLKKAELTIESTLSSQIEVENFYSLFFNGFSFTGEEWMVEAINEIPGYTAFVSPMLELIEPTAADESTLSPAMGTSTDLIGATDAWDYGYTGKGMVVAVLDTGIRQTHEAFSVMPEGCKIDEAYLKDVFAKYGDKIHAGNGKYDAGMYCNEKLPFNWDYFDGDANPNHTFSDHGTHVAGIAAGNNGKGFKGVAPDAQIVTMQVFTSDGGAYFSTLVLAMEDCVYLGVDVINMSLGSTAGFTTYDTVAQGLEAVYEALEAAGITVAAAAGNDGHSSPVTNASVESMYRSPFFAWNLDIGLVGAPACLPASFAVASVNNADPSLAYYLVSGTQEIIPTTPSGSDSLGALGEDEFEIRYVGLGTPEEIEAAGGLEGKIALVKRGSLTFVQKCINAAEAGAIAVLIYNNAEGTISTSITSDIPVGLLTLVDGEAIIEGMTDDLGTISVFKKMSYSSISMASDSSWGTTSDLKIKPEIAAPGGNITSAVGLKEDNSYETWSGTSMATPHIAGATLLVKERLREIFPEKSASEINDLAYAFLMSTAHQVNGFVRQAGAGLIDLEAALTTTAYLSVPGQQRPKLELDDSENGTFTFTFEVNNFGETTKVYSIEPSVLTEVASDLLYRGYRASGKNTTAYDDYNQETGYFLYNPSESIVKTASGFVKDVTQMCNITAPKTVTVPAGRTVAVTMTIAVGAELKAYIEENFEAGTYLEGYIKLLDQDTSGANLSIPFLGFAGDWDYVPMFDQGFWWQIPYGENNYSQSIVTWGTYLGAGTLEQPLGVNPYWDCSDATYLEDRNAISPNGDGFLDMLDTIEFTLMRNPRTMKLYVANAEGEVVEMLYESSYAFRKEYYTGNINGGPSYSNLTFEYDASELKENETGYIVLEAWLDHEEYDPADNMNGRMVFPVTKDTIAPAVKVVDGGIEIIDTQFTAYYAIYADAEKTNLISEDGVFAMERGEATFVETDLDTFYIATADYARNEAFYMVDNGVVIALEKDGFDHAGKTVVGREMINCNTGEYEYAWASFNTETPNQINFLSEKQPETNLSNDYGYDIIAGAVADDGTVYAASVYTLYTMDPETFEMTSEIGEFYNEDSDFTFIRALMKNPDTGVIYALADLSLSTSWGYHLCEVNLETAELTIVWRLSDSVGQMPHWTGWSATFVDGDTIALWAEISTEQIWLVNAKDGTQIEDDFTPSNTVAPQGETQTGVNGVSGSVLYDEELGRFYCFSNWAWFRTYRFSNAGYLVYDMNTDTWEMHFTGSGNGLFIQGIYFAEDMKPEDYYVVKNLIDAIGEVTADSGEAIGAAREAYENLSDKDKARVDNYEDLLAAEHMFVLAKAEKASFTAAKYYADLVLAELAEFDTTDLNAHQLDLFNEAVESFKAVLAEAKTSEEIAAALEALFAVIDNLDTLCPSAEFSDVDAKAWYHEAIDYAVGNGLMNGMGDGTFAPNAEMTRAQLVTVLYRMAGSPSVEGIENPFKDVAENAWFVDAVLWAADNGIVNGTSADTFSPNAAATREQFVTILYRYTAGEAVEDDKLADVPDADRISDYAREAMNWAVANGLIQGDDKGQVNPLNSATRAEIATLLMRFCESN